MPKETYSYQYEKNGKVYEEDVFEPFKALVDTALGQTFFNTGEVDSYKEKVIQVFRAAEKWHSDNIKAIVNQIKKFEFTSNDGDASVCVMPATPGMDRTRKNFKYSTIPQINDQSSPKASRKFDSASIRSFLSPDEAPVEPAAKRMTRSKARNRDESVILLEETSKPANKRVTRSTRAQNTREGNNASTPNDPAMQCEESDVFKKPAPIMEISCPPPPTRTTRQSKTSKQSVAGKAPKKTKKYVRQNSEGPVSSTATYRPLGQSLEANEEEPMDANMTPTPHTPTPQTPTPQTPPMEEDTDVSVAARLSRKRTSRVADNDDMNDECPSTVKQKKKKLSKGAKRNQKEERDALSPVATKPAPPVEAVVAKTPSASAQPADPTKTVVKKVISVSATTGPDTPRLLNVKERVKAYENRIKSPTFTPSKGSDERTPLGRNVDEPHSSHSSGKLRDLLTREEVSASSVRRVQRVALTVTKKPAGAQTPAGSRHAPVSGSSSNSSQISSAQSSGRIQDIVGNSASGKLQTLKTNLSTTSFTKFGSPTPALIGEMGEKKKADVLEKIKRDDERVKHMKVEVQHELEKKRKFREEKMMRAEEKRKLQEEERKQRLQRSASKDLDARVRKVSEEKQKEIRMQGKKREERLASANHRRQQILEKQLEEKEKQAEEKRVYEEYLERKKTYEEEQKRKQREVELQKKAEEKRILEEKMRIEKEKEKERELKEKALAETKKKDLPHSQNSKSFLGAALEAAHTIQKPTTSSKLASQVMLPPSNHPLHLGEMCEESNYDMTQVYESDSENEDDFNSKTKKKVPHWATSKDKILTTLQSQLRQHNPEDLFKDCYDTTIRALDQVFPDSRARRVHHRTSSMNWDHGPLC